MLVDHLLQDAIADADGKRHDFHGYPNIEVVQGNAHVLWAARPVLDLGRMDPPLVLSSPENIDGVAQACLRSGAGAGPTIVSHGVPRDKSLEVRWAPWAQNARHAFAMRR